MTYQILGLFLKTLADDEKYLVLHKNNLTIAIQMQLTHKQKPFSHFLEAILKSVLNLECFEQKDDPHSFFIFEITNSENVVR